MSEPHMPVLTSSAPGPGRHFLSFFVHTRRARFARSKPPLTEETPDVTKRRQKQIKKAEGGAGGQHGPRTTFPRLLRAAAASPRSGAEGGRPGPG